MPDPTSNFTLEALSEFINRQADQEVSLMWQKFDSRIKKLDEELFGNGLYLWYADTRKRFIELQTVKQRREIASRVVSAASLSVVKQKEG